MAGRLSETSVRSTLDAGHKSLPWEPGQPSGFLAGIDFDAILESPEAKQIIQSLPIQPLYYGLKRKGLADCLDVLPHLSEEQVTRIVDYDVWYKDRLVPKKAFELLSFFGEVGAEELYKRFAYLEEEYQLAMMGGLIEVFDLEEFEAMTQEQQDTLQAMPCKEVYYRVETDDEEVKNFVLKLMAAIQEHNMRYAYSVLGHCAYGVPSENEENIKRFRTARLEEDGFVTYQDSLSCFTPLDFIQLQKKWSGEGVRQGAVAELSSGDGNFLMKVLGLAQSSGWSVDEQYEIQTRLASGTAQVIGDRDDKVTELSCFL